MAVWATRVRPHSVTKISPYFLVYGQEPRIPGDPLPPERITNELSDFESIIERINNLQEGNYVLLKNEKKKKFEPPLLGPYRVKKCTPYSTYRLEDLEGRAMKTFVHHNRLVPAYSNEEIIKKPWV
ncbi:hypothetical protein BB561_004098 [Smittium simulii]|uniref:Integrase zinc-binding domain-containing protein n=1 Tax=Smittium simulii TaxID=133385 RepID=A0A2T9YI03_9FUNG|nr:hypothetical protein BB561_004098 [Smittium simulii]